MQMKIGEKIPEIISNNILSGDMPPLLSTTAQELCEQYLGQLDKYREDNMDFLTVPYELFPKENIKTKLSAILFADHLVYEYSGIDMERQQAMYITEYWLVLADAVKAKYSETETGREHLEQCYHDMHRINTLVPDKIK